MCAATPLEDKRAAKAAATSGVASTARVRRSMVIWNTKVGRTSRKFSAAIKYVSWFMALNVKRLAGILGIGRGLDFTGAALTPD